MRVFGWGIIGFFVELAGFVWFAEVFGFWALVAEIVLSALLGVVLLKSALSGEAIVEFLREVKSPKEALLANFSRIVGSILLLIPGVISDVVGLLMQFGILDFLWERLLGGLKSQYKPRNTEEIIDVEATQEDGRIVYEEKSHHRE